MQKSLLQAFISKTVLTPQNEATENKCKSLALSNFFLSKDNQELRMINDHLKEQLQSFSEENSKLKKQLNAAVTRAKELEITLLRATEEFLSNTCTDFEDEHQAKTARKRSPSKRNYKGSENKSVVYFIYCPAATAVKIGTTIDIGARISSIQTGNPFYLDLLGYVIGGRKEESILHEYFDEYHVMGEWFSLSWSLNAYIKYISEKGVFIHPQKWYRQNSSPENEKPLRDFKAFPDKEKQKVLEMLQEVDECLNKSVSGAQSLMALPPITEE